MCTGARAWAARKRMPQVESGVKDMTVENVFDHQVAKANALRLATNAVRVCVCVCVCVVAASCVCAGADHPARRPNHPLQAGGRPQGALQEQPLGRRLSGQRAGGR